MKNLPKMALCFNFWKLKKVVKSRSKNSKVEAKSPKLKQQSKSRRKISKGEATKKN